MWQSGWPLCRFMKAPWSTQAHTEAEVKSSRSRSVQSSSCSPGVPAPQMGKSCIGRRRPFVWQYQVFRLGEKTWEHEFFIWAGEITVSGRAPCQEDWVVSSLFLWNPDKPSCPTPNLGLRTFLETLASHDTWDQGVMSAGRTCLILPTSIMPHFWCP